MQNVPGRPEAIEVEAAGTDVALSNLGKTFPAVGKGTQVTICVSVLNFLEFFDDVVGAFFEARVAGSGPHETDGREIMASNVAGEIFAVEEGLPFYVEPQVKEGMYTKGIGSGFIFDAKNGFILTNNHVVDGGDNFIVRLADKREVEAKLASLKS